MAGMMADMPITVRPATPADRTDALLYEAARPYWDAFAGSEALARRLLAATWGERGHTASWEVCAVAEAGGELVGILAGFPAADGDRLAGAFLWRAVRRTAPWRWPRMARHLRAGARMAPHPPPRSFYVDSLAVAPGWRRRGVARALLDDAQRRAAAAGLDGVSLDTGVENAPARALYEGAGFRVTGVREAPSAALARAAGGPGFVGYHRA
jgi:ribosomal protein S18 acetylase RimI-like enzyme